MENIPPNFDKKQRDGGKSQCPTTKRNRTKRDKKHTASGRHTSTSSFAMKAGRAIAPPMTDQLPGFEYFYFA